MSKQIKNNQMLENFADALVDEILNTPDNDILKEAEEDYGNAKQEADKARALYENTRTLMAKKRLRTAQSDLANQKNHASRPISNINPSEAKRILDTILKENPDATREFTLAARKGKDLSDQDILGMLEDLQDLGLFHFDERQDDNE